MMNCQKCKREYFDAPAEKLRLAQCYWAYLCNDCANKFDDLCLSLEEFLSIRELEWKLIGLSNSGLHAGSNYIPYLRRQIKLTLRLREIIEEWVNQDEQQS